MSGTWQISGGTATYKLDAGFWDGTACPTPTPPSPPTEAPQAYCSCVYTYTSSYDCAAQSWSTPSQQGDVSIENDPQNIGNWEVTDGSATIRINAGFWDGATCPSPTVPSAPSAAMPDGYCSCVYTYNTTYDCASVSWGSIQESVAYERNPDPKTIDADWVIDGCSASWRMNAGLSPDCNPTTPSAPAWPSKCCAVPLYGAVSDSGTRGCCGACPWDAPSGGSGTPPTDPAACRCSPDSLGGFNGEVAPLTAQRLGGLTGGTNTVILNANTGIMTDRISVKVNGTELGGTYNGTQSVNIEPGQTSMELFLELCYLQTGGWAGSQGTDYSVNADWDLLVYAQNQPLSGGDNNLPPGSVVDIVFPD